MVVVVVWWFGGFFTDYNTTPTKLFCFVLLVGLWQLHVLAQPWASDTDGMLWPFTDDFIHSVPQVSQYSGQTFIVAVGHSNMSFLASPCLSITLYLGSEKCQLQLFQA